MLGSGGGELGGGKTHSRLGSMQGRLFRKAALWVVRFVLCFLLTCIVVVTVPFVCSSVKLPLSQPTSFCLFLSILLRTPVGGGAAAWPFCCRLQPNHNTIKAHNFYSLKSGILALLTITALQLKVLLPSQKSGM